MKQRAEEVEPLIAGTCRKLPRMKNFKEIYERALLKVEEATGRNYMRNGWKRALLEKEFCHGLDSFSAVYTKRSGLVEIKTIIKGRKVAEKGRASINCHGSDSDGTTDGNGNKVFSICGHPQQAPNNIIARCDLRTWIRSSKVAGLKQDPTQA